MKLGYGTTALGLDCSTKSIAFAKLGPSGAKVWGEVAINGGDIHEKIHDAKCKIAALALDADVVGVEGAIYVNNMKASISLAYVYGAIIGELMDNNSKVVFVEPLRWQTHIGNNLYTRAQKAAVLKAYPGHPKAWYSGEIRRQRKQFTIDYVDKKYGVMLDSDNVADAFGLATYIKDYYLA
jgi:hypothetical protein